jgi:hypothetical protein
VQVRELKRKLRTLCYNNGLVDTRLNAVSDVIVSNIVLERQYESSDLNDYYWKCLRDLIVSAEAHFEPRSTRTMTCAMPQLESLCSHADYLCILPVLLIYLALLVGVADGFTISLASRNIRGHNMLRRATPVAPLVSLAVFPSQNLSLGHEALPYILDM